MAVKPVDLKTLEDRATNIYEAIVIMSKRARQINEELKIEFNKRIEMIQSMIMSEQSEETAEPETNPDQIKIAREFERMLKPTEIALDELLSGKLQFRYKEES